jgi:HEPN domain-containing protein
MKDPKGEAARWLAQAEYDLGAAHTNADSQLFAYACFISQQAAEKAIKAFLYARGARQVLGHSVADLCRQAARFDKQFASLATQAGKLDRLYIPTRYPNGLPGGIPAEEYDREDAKQSEALAHQVVDLVKKLIDA